MIVALAGGVGGAKLAEGLAQTAGRDLSVIVNTADDFRHLGLHISPDLDTVMYTLAGIANPQTGWGLQGETWNFLDQLGCLGGETWFRLGDRDLATHIFRSERLSRGDRLSTITGDLCKRLGVAANVLPMTDQPVGTIVHTPEGPLPFQEYFVARQCAVPVTGFTFAGIENAAVTPEILEALANPRLACIAIAPSNPFVSIDPILAVPKMRTIMTNAGAPIVAVSPIIAGQAVKGPAAKMMSELGQEVSVLSIVRHYGALLSGIVIDEQDESLKPQIEQRGLKVAVTDTLMRDSSDRRRVAEACVRLADECRRAAT